MAELAILEQRRQLVELSADLQRATITRRLASIEQHPSHVMLGMLAAVSARPGVRKLASPPLMAFRVWRRRRRARA